MAASGPNRGGKGSTRVPRQRAINRTGPATQGVKSDGRCLRQPRASESRKSQA